MNINDRIREVRDKFCNGSNQEFANRLGKNPNTTSNWVRNGYSVGRGVSSEIAHIFGVNIEWLLYGNGDMINNGGNPDDNNQLNPNSMDMSFLMDYIDTLKKQLEAKDGQIKDMAEEKRAHTKLLTEMANLLSELGVDKSFSRRLGAVQEEQDKLGQ